MHDPALPVIYHTVDISCHNQTGTLSDNDKEVSASHWLRDEAGYAEYLQRRQRIFIETLTKHPNYGNYVASIIWTYQSWCSSHGRSPNKFPIWSVFRSLKRVSKVDICSFDKQEHRPTPGPLFQNATAVRVGGRLTYSFFRALIPKALSRLVSLELENCQSFGQLKDGQPLPNFESVSELAETEDADN